MTFVLVLSFVWLRVST